MAYGQIVSMRLANGQEVEFADWSDQPLFSKIQIQNGATALEMPFFQYVQGDPVPCFAPTTATSITPRTANERDTNLAEAGGMSVQEEFMCFSIRPEVHYERVSDPDAPDFGNLEALCAQGAPPAGFPTLGMLTALSLRCTLFLEISEKRFSEAGFSYFNAGMGPMPVSATIAGVNPATQGLPSQEAVRTLVIPSHIGGTEKFRVVMANPDGAALEVGYNFTADDTVACDASAVADIRVYLDGLHRRGTA